MRQCQSPSPRGDPTGDRHSVAHPVRLLITVGVNAGLGDRPGWPQLKAVALRAGAGPRVVYGRSVCGRLRDAPSEETAREHQKQ